MEDKVCLVTGSTSGTGLATAFGLARQGATVILVSHDPEEGEEALAQGWSSGLGEGQELLAATGLKSLEKNRCAGSDLVV